MKQVSNTRTLIQILSDAENATITKHSYTYLHMARTLKVNTLSTLLVSIVPETGILPNLVWFLL